MRTLAEAKTNLTGRLRQAGWELAPGATTPLEQIDFSKLVPILDHEERFLEEAFLETLVALRSARERARSDRGKITAADVDTALHMLAVAVSRQPEPILSSASKGMIKDSCGFC